MIPEFSQANYSKIADGVYAVSDNLLAQVKGKTPKNDAEVKTQKAVINIIKNIRNEAVSYRKEVNNKMKT